MWEVATTSTFDEWFAGIDEQVQIAIAARVELLQTFGPQLKRPHADTLNDSKHPNMKELRIDEQGRVIRIAFAFDPRRSAILLVAGEKQGTNEKRFYKQLLAHADALYAAHLAKHKKKG